MITHQPNTTLSRSYLGDKFIRTNLFFSLLLNIGLWSGLGWQARNFAELIALHYNIYFGIDLLGSRYQIFLLPILGLIFLIINFLLGLAIYRQEKILSYFLVGASSFAQIILSLAAIFIILINF